MAIGAFDYVHIEWTELKGEMRYAIREWIAEDRRFADQVDLQTPDGAVEFATHLISAAVELVGVDNVTRIATDPPTDATVHVLLPEEREG